MDANNPKKYTVELFSVKPFLGKVIDLETNEEFEFDKPGRLIDFIAKKSKTVDNYLDYSTKSKSAVFTKDKKNSEVKSFSETAPAVDKSDEKTKMMIAQLLENSNFSVEELEQMNISTLYQAYNLIIRNKKQGVEDEIRNKLKTAVDFQKQYSNSQTAVSGEENAEQSAEKLALEKQQKKELRKQLKAQKKLEKEQKKLQKLLEKKDIKKK